ncbi:hypothetical protein ACLOJK_032066 [Asimina triloba]
MEDIHRVKCKEEKGFSRYQAAPKTETPIATAIPIAEKVYGEICTRARDQELDPAIAVYDADVESEGER